MVGAVIHGRVTVELQWREQADREAAALQRERDQRKVAEKQTQFLAKELETTDDRAKQTQTQLTFHEQALAISNEADPKRGTLSWRSPLAQALMGGETGDIVEMQSPKGEIEILRVEN